MSPRLCPSWSPVGHYMPEDLGSPPARSAGTNTGRHCLRVVEPPLYVRAEGCRHGVLPMPQNHRGH